MQGQSNERWKELCELAAREQNPQRLMELVAEINRLLEEKEQRLIASSKLQSPNSIPSVRSLSRRCEE